MELTSENSSENIPPAIRPCKTVVDQVKNTLSFLLTSAVNSIKKADSEKNEIPVEKSSSVDNPQILARKNKNLGDSPKVVSRSEKLRSKEAFQKRVKSFTLQNWCGKPLLLNPMLYAQYGWRCSGEDMVCCSSCGAVQCVQLPWPNATNYEEQCLKTRSKIVSGHMKVCSWSSSYCNDSFIIPFHPRYSNTQQQTCMLEEFQARAKKLLHLKNDLPLITDDVKEEMELSEKILVQLCAAADFNDNDDIENLMVVSSIILALSGWDTKSDGDSSNPGIFCNESSRLVGLWNFYSVGYLPNETDAPVAKKQKKDEDFTAIEKSYFHPLKQHHVWSPWVVTIKPMSADELSDERTSATYTDDDVLPGWKMLKNLICSDGLTTSKPTMKTPPRAAVKQARRILSEWSSPM
uniref:NIPA-like protein n=1 Tax=Ciona intestinalis TaxID=7719 RepID=F6XF81_CIOIN|nr:NIPA-like protein [Ciona intestinalis]|eukprot:XP_002128832.1 NIPA-like protein [Ciona intestinalis]